MRVDNMSADSVSLDYLEQEAIKARTNKVVKIYGPGDRHPGIGIFGRGFLKAEEEAQDGQKFPSDTVLVDNVNQMFLAQMEFKVFDLLIKKVAPMEKARIAKEKITQKTILVRVNKFHVARFSRGFVNQFLGRPLGELELAILGRHGLSRCVHVFPLEPKTVVVLLYGHDEDMLKLTATAAAEKVNMNFMVLSAKVFARRDQAMGVEMVHQFFRRALEHEPCVLYLYDVDVICGKMDSYKRIKYQFLHEIDLLKFGQRKIYIIIGATKPWEANAPFMCHVDNKIFVQSTKKNSKKMAEFRAQYDPFYRQPPTPMQQPSSALSFCCLM